MRSTWLFSRCNSSAPNSGWPSCNPQRAVISEASLFPAASSYSVRMACSRPSLSWRGNGTVGRESRLLDWDRRRFREELHAVRGSLDFPLPLRGEESLAPPVVWATPWTPAIAASLFCGWDSSLGHLPPPHGGSRMVACAEAAAITGGYSGGIMGPRGRGTPVRRGHRPSCPC